MKNNYALFFLFSLMLLSCDKSDDMNMNSGGDGQSNLLNGKINVMVNNCLNLFCSETSVLPDVEVKLQATGSETFYRMGTTNEEGEISFSSINVQELSVLATYDGQEYKEQLTIGQDDILHVEIVFSPHCELNGSSLVNCNTKIDLEHMSIGQESKYALYKTNEKQLSDDKTFQYTGDILTLKVVDRIDETLWIVEEEFLTETQDSLFEYMINTSPTTCIWDVQEDHFKIYPSQGSQPSNFSAIYDSDHETYEIPLIALGVNSCEMDLWYPKDCDNVGTPRIFGAEFNGITYENELILDRKYSFDIPEFGIIYSKEEGIVHSFTYGDMAYTHAYGFDLINE